MKNEPATLENSALIYVYEERPGITRRKRGRGFSFYDPNGEIIKDKKERARLLSVAVPPSYEDVWYCPLANGHLQATGLDSNAKKQYFYHDIWAKLKSAHKFSKMEDFALKLPALRQKMRLALAEVEEDERLDKTVLLYAMLRVLDRTGMRVGSVQAADNSHTYGLTTLLKQHLDNDGTVVHFSYTGKGGVDLEREFRDEKLALFLDHCAEIGGQNLFEYMDAKGVPHQITSGDVNNFIKMNMGDDFTAKDFRTWRFNSLFVEKGLKVFTRAKAYKLKDVMQELTQLTGNTEAILKRNYLHPGLYEVIKAKAYEDLLKVQSERSGLLKSEQIVLGYLQTKDAVQALKAA